MLDIGCGLGDTTLRLAGLVGASGHAHGVDVAERMIDTAIKEAAEAGVENVSFETRDVEVTKFDGTFDYAFSRMGTMFFANPVVALRNVRDALAPGGLLNMVVWRRKLDNEFMHRAELVVAEYLDEPEESQAPRCGPGPFSMANADSVSDVLKYAGYKDIRLARQDFPYKLGNDLEQAVEFNMVLGPAAEILRMWGDRVDEIRPKIAQDLREALADFVVDGGADYEEDAFGYWVYVDDVDAEVERLRAARAPIVAEPEDQPWGERVARTRDPHGNLVYLAVATDPAA